MVERDRDVGQIRCNRCSVEWGRSGMHMAPRGDSQDMHDTNPPATVGYVAREPYRRGLGFLLAREYFGPDRPIRSSTQETIRRRMHCE
jgi:hypothetical protein